jgi:hypothetical protein
MEIKMAFSGAKIGGRKPIVDSAAPVSVAPSSQLGDF